MNKIEKIKKLQEVEKILKSEFIGLDSIIGELINAVTPWYVTPEVIERPCVISLWGMTGTGKSSVVKRLIELLGIESKSLFFDCGTESNEGNSDVASKICDHLKMDDVETKLDTEDMVFVFDEFQYARTLNEQGEEVNKCNLRPVWEMMDSGILRIPNTDYDLISYFNFVEDLHGFIDTTPGSESIVLVDGKIINPGDVKTMLENLGYFYYDRGIPGLMPKPGRYGLDDDEDETKKEDPYAPLVVVENRYTRTIIRKLGMYTGETVKTADIINSISRCGKLGELLSVLDGYKNILRAPRKLNCQKALVFIIGNLDEAYTCGSEINPDIDADIFWNETEKVNISDIKEALQKRFRAEQIARFGNSIIKYPSLKREHFEAIIKKEAGRILSEFKKTTGINVELGDSLYDLLYCEGVYPVQGVRPLLSTIGTMLTPLLSDILCEDYKKAWIDIVDPESGYNMQEKSIRITNGEGLEKIKTIPLTLGALRDPKKRGTRYACSIHEAGHAIVMAWCTGKAPDAVISVSTDGGGFCITYDKERDKEIRCKQDVQNNVMISLGGWCAEDLIFDSEDRLLGSGSDIQEAREELGTAAYELGYKSPILYINKQTSAGDQVPAGFDDKELEIFLEKEYDRLKSRTEAILDTERELLCRLGLRLAECGCMKADEFKDYIRKYGKVLTLGRMEATVEENSYSRYERDIRKILGEIIENK